MPIRLLPDELVNRIAAGEVVERPASVIKELVENAIDAGASQISITTSNGGKTLMRVADDGIGMDETDLALAITRHATSKLNEDRLDTINTLGFRGEALASIASVSNLSIRSRTNNIETGMELVAAKAGAVMHPIAMNKGTVVNVENLFANIPARLKFLKSDRSETGAITEVVKRLAMGNPNVHFVLEGPDRQTSNWPGQTGENAYSQRLGQVLGAAFLENAVPVANQRHGVVVTGLVGLPTFTRANSLLQFFFVNGRSVRDKILFGAVRAAFADFVFRDRYPVVALSLAIDPGEVDVNVHPAKTELRFRDSGGVRSAVIVSIGMALAEAGYRASSHVADKTLSAFKPSQNTSYAPSENDNSTPSAASSGSYSNGGHPAPNRERTLNGLNEPSARYTPEPESPELEDFPLGSARAQMFENYIVAQNGQSLLLIDQHAAHERLVYERFKTELATGQVKTQSLLIPVIVELTDEECARLEEASVSLEKLGLHLERFGPRAIAVRETPAILGQGDVTALINDLVDGLAEWSHIAAIGERADAIIGRMACHGSVRSGRRLHNDEMNALLRQMEKTPHSGQCIHGRPTYVELKLRDIERLFGRS